MKKEKKTKPSPWKPGMTIQEMYEARPKMWIMVTAVLVIMAFLMSRYHLTVRKVLKYRCLNI